MVEWTSESPGGYTADISLLLEDEVLLRRKQEFQVLEKRALTCSGELRAVRAPEEGVPGQPIKIEADFQNTGEVEFEATLMLEVSRGGELLKIVEGQSLLLTVGDTGTLAADVDPEGDGDYLVEGRVVYAGKSVEISPVSVSVRSSTPSQGNVRAVSETEGRAELPIAPVASVVAGMALAALLIIVLERRRRATR